MDVEFCIEALEDAMQHHGRPEIYNTDQGSQFTSPRFTQIRQVCRNVKRWRDAKMALRWTAIGMLEAAKCFRRLKAHKQLPVLRAGLLQHREPGNTGFDQTAEAT